MRITIMGILTIILVIMEGTTIMGRTNRIPSGSRGSRGSRGCRPILPAISSRVTRPIIPRRIFPGRATRRTTHPHSPTSSSIPHSLTSRHNPIHHNQHNLIHHNQHNPIHHNLIHNQFNPTHNHLNLTHNHLSILHSLTSRRRAMLRSHTSRRTIRRSPTSSPRPRQCPETRDLPMDRPCSSPQRRDGQGRAR